jgi:uncharacterized damage-inducible protein DinB
VKEALTRLYDHLVWADDALLTCLKRLTPPPPRALELYCHVLAAEKLWLDRIRGQPPAVIAVWPSLTLGECASLSREMGRGLRETLDASTEMDLGRRITYATSKGDRFINTLGDVLLHVAMHGSYHRGQAAAVVRAAGGEPVNTDYIAYVRTR